MRLAPLQFNLLPLLLPLYCFPLPFLSATSLSPLTPFLSIAPPLHFLQVFLLFLLEGMTEAGA